MKKKWSYYLIIVLAIIAILINLRNLIMGEMPMSGVIFSSLLVVLNVLIIVANIYLIRKK